jgi:hypothetical protein
VISVVGKMRSAYRRQTIKYAGSIATRADAYARIRGYLVLCMPPTIEARIHSVLQNAEATSNGKGDIELTAAPADKKG